MSREESKAPSFQTEIIDRARSKFAANGEKGIEFIIRNGLIDDNPREIAHFLHHCGFLDRMQIGEYLSTLYCLKIIHLQSMA